MWTDCWIDGWTDDQWDNWIDGWMCARMDGCWIISEGNSFSCCVQIDSIQRRLSTLPATAALTGPSLLILLLLLLMVLTDANHRKRPTLPTILRSRPPYNPPAGGPKALTPSVLRENTLPNLNIRSVSSAEI